MLVQWQRTPSASLGALFNSFDQFLAGVDAGNDAISFNDKRGPHVSYEEGEDAFVFTLDAPGVHPDQVDVRVGTGHLTIKAQRTLASEKGWRPLRRERRSWVLERRFRLKSPVDPTGVVALAANGVITIRVPKCDAAPVRQIPVTSK